MPDNKERLALWKKSLPATIAIDPLVNLDELANKYEITGAAVLNVMHYAMLKAIASGSSFINQKDITEGIAGSCASQTGPWPERYSKLNSCFILTMQR